MSDSNPILNSAKVLIIEDEAVTRTALTVLLEYQGATVVAVGLVQDGITTIESGFQPDLVLSNIHLPDGNGTLVLQAVRRQDQQLGRHTPAIALTGEALDSIQTDPDSAGFQVYLSKPFDSLHLLKTIAVVMGREE